MCSVINNLLSKISDYLYPNAFKENYSYIGDCTINNNTYKCILFITHIEEITSSKGEIKGNLLILKDTIINVDVTLSYDEFLPAFSSDLYYIRDNIYDIKLYSSNVFLRNTSLDGIYLEIEKYRKII